MIQIGDAVLVRMVGVRDLKEDKPGATSTPVKAEVVQINPAHRWYRVEYRAKVKGPFFTKREICLTECFKYIPDQATPKPRPWAGHRQFR